MRTLKWVNRNEPTLPSLLNNGFSSFFNDDFIRQDMISSRPRVNIAEDEQAYSIELAAPGLSKEDFHIDLDKDILTISVEKETENKEENDRYTKREFSYNSFKRSFTVPETVDVDAIKGTYSNGILTISLPKNAEVKTKRAIEIS